MTQTKTNTHAFSFIETHDINVQVMKAYTSDRAVVTDRTAQNMIKSNTPYS
jgi:hypothetical protein